MKLLSYSLPLLLAAASAQAEVWDFKVYLDDTPVGFHRFTVNQTGGGKQVHSEAKFDVKFLMVTAYRYFHEAKESWQGACLQALTAQTDDNGDKTSVQGAEKGNAFDLAVNQKPVALPDCVWTFAYWNPAMLEQKQLLNPQTGEYLPVKFELKGVEPIAASGKDRLAKHYLLDAGKFQIELWYAADDQRWLALDSKLENGRRLRYRIE